MTGICHCGHEKAEHFLADGVRCNCMRQCDCKVFLDSSRPAPLPPRPKHAAWCRCYRCKQYVHVVRDERPTDPIPTPRNWP